MFFYFLLPSTNQSQGICIWQHCWRFKTVLSKNFLPEMSVKCSSGEYVQPTVISCFPLQLNSRNTSYEVSGNYSTHFECIFRWKSCEKYQNFEFLAPCWRRFTEAGFSFNVFSLKRHMYALDSCTQFTLKIPESWKIVHLCQNLKMAKLFTRLLFD